MSLASPAASHAGFAGSAVSEGPAVLAGGAGCKVLVVFVVPAGLAGHATPCLRSSTTH